MKDYFSSFQAIKKSIEQIQSVDTISNELNCAALNLGENINPCFEEIKQAFFRLEKSMIPCFQCLEEAEDVWKSKEKICQISTKDIIEEMGILTGKEIRIRELSEKYQEEIIYKVISHWTNKSDEFRKKSFKWDEKKDKFHKDSLNFFEKDELSKIISQNLNELAMMLKEEITLKLSLIYEKINTILSPFFDSCINTLDTINKNSLEKKILKLQKELELQLNEPMENLPEVYVNNYRQTLIQSLNNLNKQGYAIKLFPLLLKDVDDFCLEIKNITEKLIKDIFAQKIEMAVNAIETNISFYNDLLEKQARYKEELVSQHNIEKAWIDQQKAELDKVQLEIKIFLDNFDE